MCTGICRNRFLSCLIGVLSLGGFTAMASSSETGEEDREVDINEVIMHHVLDNHSWHFFDGRYGTLHLPVILYSPDGGLEIFSSSRFYDTNHNLIAYKGYKLDHNHIVREDTGEAVFDLSITKNVMMLFITSALLLLLFRSVAGSYKKRKGKVPRGLQSFMEPIIIFVTDEVIKPNAGPNYSRYTPYLLTLFFFILIGNILGLLPGAGNLTGNIAVTMTLALFTFLITTFSGNKNYWTHIFWTPGVPLVLRPILLAVEVIGVFTKPFALMIRLFAAITAGHIVILSLLSMVFIFRSYVVGAGASVFVLLVSLVELLVAGIQAYVFTLFSALYIGLATAKHEH